MEALADYLIKINAKFDRGYTTDNVYYYIDHALSGKKVPLYFFLDTIAHLVENRDCYKGVRKRRLLDNTGWKSALAAHVESQTIDSLFDYLMQYVPEDCDIGTTARAKKIWMIIQSFRNGHLVGPKRVDLIVRYLIGQKCYYYG